MLDTFKWRSVLTLALFLIGQSFATAHAIEYGNQPHEHNGVVCLTLLNDEPDGLEPAKQLVTQSFGLDESKPFSLPNPVLTTKNLTLKPPPTGPPSA